MPQHHFTLTITASVVAWYAAIVATVSAAVQVGNFLRDRVSVKVTYLRGVQVEGIPLEGSKTFAMVCAVNVGKRPLTINIISLEYLSGGFVQATDTRPRLPCTLCEGQQVQAFIDQTGIGRDDIACALAFDAAGRVFQKNVAPWHKRVPWFFHRMKKLV